MVFINETGTIGVVILGLNNITGSLFLTLFMILIILLVIAVALRIPIEAIAILYLPFLLTITAFVGDFLATLGVALIYLGIILGKNLLSPR